MKLQYFKIFLGISLILTLGFTTNNWQKSPIDKLGNLLVLKIFQGPPCCTKCKPEITVSVDKPWSVWLNYESETVRSFTIFDNLNKKVFHTKDFNQFLSQLANIPQNTSLRIIDKCTVSYLNIMPENDKLKFLNLLSENKIEYETKSMFCNCCAKKLVYLFKK